MGALFWCACTHTHTHTHTRTRTRTHTHTQPHAHAHTDTHTRTHAHTHTHICTHVHAYKIANIHCISIASCRFVAEERQLTATEQQDAGADEWQARVSKDSFSGYYTDTPSIFVSWCTEFWLCSNYSRSASFSLHCKIRAMAPQEVVWLLLIQRNVTWKGIPYYHFLNHFPETSRILENREE